LLRTTSSDLFITFPSWSSSRLGILLAAERVIRRLILVLALVDGDAEVEREVDVGGGR
jgi:hypothetical protein